MKYAKKLLAVILTVAMILPVIAADVKAYEEWDYETTLTVEGAAMVGETLYARIGGEEPTGVKFEWRITESDANVDDGSIIAGANDSSYTLTKSDEGKYVYVVIYGDGIKYDKNLFGISRKSEMVAANEAMAIVNEDVTCIEESSNADVAESISWNTVDTNVIQAMTSMGPGELGYAGTYMQVVGVTNNADCAWYVTSSIDAYNNANNDSAKGIDFLRNYSYFMAGNDYVDKYIFAVFNGTDGKKYKSELIGPIKEYDFIWDSYESVRVATPDRGQLVVSWKFYGYEAGTILSVLNADKITRCVWYEVSSKEEADSIKNYTSGKPYAVGYGPSYDSTGKSGKYAFAVVEYNHDNTRPLKSNLYGPFISLDDPEIDIPNYVWIDAIEGSYEYTGKAITPEVRVYNQKTLLTKNVDYTVAYLNNVNVGNAIIKVTLKGNYEGTLTKTFQITKASLKNAIVDDIYLVKNGKPQKPVPVVKYMLNGKTITLKYNKDFGVSYPSYDPTKNAYEDNGEYDIYIYGKGNFVGDCTIKEIINTNKNVAKLSCKVDPVTIPATEKYVEGKTYESVVTVKDGGAEIKGKQFATVEEAKAYANLPKSEVGHNTYAYAYSDNTGSGVGKVTIYGVNANGYTGKVVKTFKITGNKINKAVVTVNNPSELIYTGTEVIPSVKVTLNGKDLVANQDYSVSYIGNVKAGTGAAVVVKGINVYEGSVKKTFTILPKTIAESAIENIPAQAYTKGGVRPGVVINVPGLTEKKDFTIKYENNTKLAKASDANKPPQVVITFKGNYSGTVTKKFDIVSGSLKSLSANSLAKDFVYADKAGTCKTTVSVVDSNGKKLSPGTDYSRTVAITYAQDVTIKKKDGGEEKKVSGNSVDAANDIIPAGTKLAATVTATEGGLYYDSVNKDNNTLTLIFRCVSRDIAKANVLPITKDYLGRPVELSAEDIKASFKIDAKTKHDLVPNVDFEIVPGSYVNNAKKGSAKVTIRGLGNYGGTKTISFKINAKKN